MKIKYLFILSIIVTGLSMMEHSLKARAVQRGGKSVPPTNCIEN